MASVTPAGGPPGDQPPGPDILDGAAAGGLLIRGGALRFAAFIATVGLSVISAAVLTRHLGVSRFGEYTTIMSLVAVVAAVTDSGMSNIGTREYAILYEPERGLLMRDLLTLRVTLTMVGVGVIVIWSIARGYDEALLLGAVGASVATVALVFQHTLTIPLTTDLRLGALSGLELGRQALLVAGIVALALAGAGLLPLLAVALPVNALLIIPTALLVRRRISVRPSFRPSAWPALLRVTVVFSLATAVGTVYVYAAQILTSVVASKHQSGLFAVSFRVFIVSAAIPGLLVGSALPILSRAARDDRDRLVYILQRILEVTLIGGVGLALTVSAGAGFIVSVVAGPRYAAAAPVLQIQAFAMIGSFVVAGWSFGLLSLHLHRGLLLSNLAALIVSVTLTIVLAHSDGAQGAAIATICGETALAVTSLLALAAGRPAFRPQLAIVGKVLLAGAVAVAGAFVPGMPSVVRAIVAVLLYGAVIVASRALPAEFRELLPVRARRR